MARGVRRHVSRRLVVDPASAAFVAAAVLALVGLGALAAHKALYGLAGAVVILAIGIAVIDLRFFPVLAVPCSLVVVRYGGYGSGLSVSDLVLFLAIVSALPLLRMREAPELRRLLWVSAAYQVLILPTVIDNPYRGDFIEWLHEAALVAGSLVVGWVVGRGGRSRIALTLFVGGSCIVAVWACGVALTTHLQPTNLPLGLQKNFVGDLLAFAAVIAFARPAFFGWTTRWSRTAIAFCLVGILASQSKQAMISLAVGVVIVVLRGAHLGRRGKGLLFLMIPLVIFAYVAASRELASTNRFNSVHQRLTWYSQSIEVWHASVWVGVGLRWWFTTRFANPFQPPNAEAEMLTSAGILGIIALVVLFGGSLIRLWQLPPTYGTLAFAVVAMRIVQGQFDVFWVAGQGSLPWLVAGIATGALALDRARSAEAPPPGSPPPPSERRRLGRALPVPG